MKTIQRIKRYLSDPRDRFTVNAKRGIYNKMSDEEFLKRGFKIMLGYDLNLDDPQTFNEKLQWLKLHDRKPEYTRMVDKFDVKEYAADKIGNDYIIPTLGVWNSFEDIDFSSLPNQFVLKCTHDSGGIFICKDKHQLDIGEAKKKITKSFNTNFYYKGREWPYKDISPRIIAEKYITDDDADGLTDYKLHCFHEDPKIILVCKGRFSSSGLSEDFFDKDWNHLDVRRPGTRQCNHQIERPAELDQLFTLAKMLSCDIPFVRVDFYIVKGKILFGELTFYPTSGFHPFIPESFDFEMGKMLSLKN